MNNYNAIVFFRPEKLMKPRKYRNISKVDNFSIFCLSSGAWYINFYNAKTKEFIKRIYINK